MAKKLKDKYTRLMCTDCKNINYTTYQSNKRDEPKLGGDDGINKHCKVCRKHTTHKTTK